MFGTTMMLTLGQALDRAMNEEHDVRVKLGDEWISGRVLATDSQGVVFLDESGDTIVLRMDALTAIRIPGEDRAAGGDQPQIPTQERVTF